MTKSSLLKKNTVRGTHFFLTLSQSQFAEPEQIINMIMNTETFLKHYAVVREQHTKSAKGIHFHVYLRYAKQKELALRHFDYLQPGVHLEITKSRECLLAYLTKEEQLVANFDFWKELLSKSSTFPRTLVRMVVDYGYDLSDIQLKYRDVLSDKPWQKVCRFAEQTLYLSKITAKVYKPLRFIDQNLMDQRLTREQRLLFDSCPNYQKFVDIVNNLKKFGSAHPHKGCSTAIVGLPSIGKTSLLLALSNYYPFYRFPSDGWHAQSYKDAFFSGWIWEEWSLCVLPYEDLLLLTEGYPVDLRIKGSKTYKDDRPMLFLTSNETIETKISRSWRSSLTISVMDLRTKALKTRIQELDFGSKSIFWLTNLFVAETEDTCPLSNPIESKIKL